MSRAACGAVKVGAGRINGKTLQTLVQQNGDMLKRCLLYTSRLTGQIHAGAAGKAKGIEVVIEGLGANALAQLDIVDIAALPQSFGQCDGAVGFVACAVVGLLCHAVSTGAGKGGVDVCKAGVHAHGRGDHLEHTAGVVQLGDGLVFPLDIAEVAGVIALLVQNAVAVCVLQLVAVLILFVDAVQLRLSAHQLVEVIQICAVVQRVVGVKIRLGSHGKDGTGLDVHHEGAAAVLHRVGCNGFVQIPFRDLLQMCIRDRRECGSYHITVKGGKYLEALSKADTIVFDKTGTLTRATPQVVEVVPFSGCNEREVLQLAACLEEHFPHSMANAVVRAAKERGISHEEMHSEVEYIVAHGIASRVGGERVVIGSHHFVFEDEKCTIPTAEQQKFDALKPAYSHLYMAASGQLVGVICISDPLRPEAAAVLNGLRALGIRNTVMMTGDSERTAAAIAKQVGVDRFFAEVLPEDKANFVQQAKAEGHTVVMIGDGINDSPALSAADIGIAINSGAAIAREIADVTIKADSLEELVALKAIANSLQKRVHANYRFVLTFNSALIALGALGILQPASSAMLHNLSTIGISLKSMTNLLPENKAPQLKA